MVNIQTFLLDSCLCLSFVFDYAMIVYFLPRSICERVLPMLPEGARMLAFYVLVLTGTAFLPIAQNTARVFWKRGNARLTRRLVAMVERMGMSGICWYKTLLIVTHLLNPVLLTILALHFGRGIFFYLVIALVAVWCVSVVLQECVWHAVGGDELMGTYNGQKSMRVVLKAGGTFFRNLTVKQILVIMMYGAVCIAGGHVLCKIIMDKFDENEYLEETSSCRIEIDILSNYKNDIGIVRNYDERAKPKFL